MKCIICDKKAVKYFTPDLDIQGLGACKKHVDHVWLGYMMLIQGDERMFKDYIKELRKENKAKLN